MCKFFDLEWKRKDIIDLVDKHPYLEHSEHKDLKSLCCVPFAEDDNGKDYSELIYVVPKDWLKAVAKEMYGIENVDYWLQSEYVTEESEVIFVRGINENQIVMVNFN